MTPFNPPTDNLYKFCALTGVALTLFALYVPYLLSDQLYSKLAATAHKLNRIRIEQRHLEIESNRIKVLVENFKSGQTTETILRSGKIPIAITPKELDEKTLAMYKALKEIELGVAESESLVRETGRLDSQLEFVFALAFLTLLAGVGLAHYGFRNWYHRVQKYQDLALKKRGKRFPPSPALSVNARKLRTSSNGAQWIGA